MDHRRTDVRADSLVIHNNTWVSRSSLNIQELIFEISWVAKRDPIAVTLRYR